jgi:hypothetical protein
MWDQLTCRHIYFWIRDEQPQLINSGWVNCLIRTNSFHTRAKLWMRSKNQSHNSCCRMKISQIIIAATFWVALQKTTHACHLTAASNSLSQFPPAGILPCNIHAPQNYNAPNRMMHTYDLTNTPKTPNKRLELRIWRGKSTVIRIYTNVLDRQGNVRVTNVPTPRSLKVKH